MSSKHKNTDISPKNRKKKYCAFNDNWLRDNNYKQWIKKVNDYTVKCLWCNTNITIKYEGVLAINRHSIGKSQEKCKYCKNK